MSTALANQHNAAFYSNIEEKWLHIRIGIVFCVAYLPNTTARRWGYDATVTDDSDVEHRIVAPSVALHPALDIHTVPVGLCTFMPWDERGICVARQLWCPQEETDVHLVKTLQT